ncbi:MAG: DUF922 domain-containing protein [Pseudomonadota bacterium]
MVHISRNITATDLLQRATLTAFVLGLLSAPAIAAPELTIREVFYKVDGLNAKDLGAQMKRRGPKNFWAYTRWDIKWSAQCEVEVVVTFTMPKHTNRGALSPTFRANWDRMIAALKLHEKQHGAHGIAAAREIEQAGCKKTRPIVRKYNRADRVFDKRTNHGAKTGVVLN